MEFNTQPTSTQEELTPIKAQAIYDLIVEFGNADKAFKNKTGSDLEPQHFPIVDKEADKVIAELRSKLGGSFLLEAKIPATYDEMGEVVTEEIPAVYYTVTTETALKASLSSELLDTDKVYTDFKGDKTFTELKGE